MRDNHEGLPEIINTYERDSLYYCSISIKIGSDTKTFEFGIDQESFKAIKRILGMQPFEKMPGIKYIYFFCPVAGRKSTDLTKYFCHIRIEQEKRGKEFEVAAPEQLIANLMWFFKAKNFNELAYLPEISQEQ
jgi:hypothetical protein